jgi:O-antigen ligase
MVVFGGVAIAWRQLWSQKAAFSGPGKIVLALLAIWLGWGFLSAFFSSESASSMVAMLRLVTLAVGGLACGQWMQARWTQGWTLAAGAAVSAVAVYCLWRFPALGKAASPPFFQDTNIFSAVMALLLPLLAAVVAAWPRNWKGWVAAAMCLLLLAATVIFHSRGAWLSLIGVLLALPLLFLPKPGLRIAWLLAILILGGAYFGYRASRPAETPTTTDPLGQLRSIGELGQDFSNRERLMRWECAWRMAIDQPAFGLGPGQYPEVFRHYLRGWTEADRISYWFGWRFGAHSDSLTTLGETGFVGFFAFVGMLIAAGFMAVQRVAAAKTRFSMESAMALALLSWGIHGCFNDLLSDGCLTVWAFFLIGNLLQPAPDADAAT